MLQAELATGPAGDEGDREDSWGHYVVQGTCLTLEKKYFRLTGPPDPSVIRPPQVLKAALKRVVHMYRAGTCDMHYTEDQLKAMRQDVTVQHVKGSLPVQIYEAHARACLEHGNGGDFNQCQTRLKVLYEEGGQGCVEEFVAYRIIYHAILRGKESASLLQEMEHLSPQVHHQIHSLCTQQTGTPVIVTLLICTQRLAPISPQLYQDPGKPLHASVLVCDCS